MLVLENLSVCIDANLYAVNHATADLTIEGDVEVSLRDDEMIVLQVTGTASASGDVVLAASTAQPFKPLTELLPTFSMMLSGTFTGSTSESMSILPA